MMFTEVPTFSDEELAPIKAAILQEQGETPDPSLAHIGARRIGGAIWSLKLDAEFNGAEFVPRISAEEAHLVSEKCAELAAALSTASKLLDELNRTRIDGREDSIPLIATGRFEHVEYGKAQTPFGGHAFNRGRRIAARFFDLCNTRGAVAEAYTWPERAVEYARGVKGVFAQHFAAKLLDDLSHDVEVASILHEAIADEYGNKHGGPTSTCPLTFGICALAWFDSAGTLPIGKTPSAKSNRADLYPLIANLHGTPLPRGFSRETFAEVVTRLSDARARDVFRYQWKLKLPKRTRHNEY